MSQRQKLSREELKQLKELCKQGSYEAVVALLDVHIQEAKELCCETTVDHRYIQGKYKALRDLLHDIVKKTK